MTTPRKPPKRFDGLSERQAWVVIGTVLTIWVLSTLAGMAKLNGWQPPEGINSIVLVVVGAALITKKKDGGE